MFKDSSLGTKCLSSCLLPLGKKKEMIICIIFQDLLKDSNNVCYRQKIVVKCLERDWESFISLISGSMETAHCVYLVKL